MLTNFIKAIIGTLGIAGVVRMIRFLTNNTVQTVNPPQHHDAEPVFEPQTQDAQQDAPIEHQDEVISKDSVIAGALFAQAMAKRKQDVDDKTNEELKKQSETLASALPDELQDIIASRFLIQYKKRKVVEKRRERKEMLAERRRMVEKLITAGVFHPSYRRINMADIEFGYSYEDGFYYTHKSEAGKQRLPSRYFFSG